MRENSLAKQFVKYVGPSMFTTLLSGLYTIVDGFFVGNAVGDVGLAAIGLVWPITALLLALGVGIGSGGSVLMSRFRGEKNDVEADNARGNTLVVLGITSVLFTILFLLFTPALTRFFGAEGEVYDAAIAYIRIISIGASMQIISSGLVPLIRNSGATVHAMIIMGTGLVANIILDAIFTITIPLGLAGAAVATISAQAITVLLSVIWFARDKKNPIRKNQFKIKKDYVKRIIRVGISPFGMTLMPPFVTVLTNWQCIAYGGDIAVSAYSVLNYYIEAAVLLLGGIGEGIQPIISYFNGAKAYESMRKIRNAAVVTGLTFSVIFLGIGFPLSNILGPVFSTSIETATVIERALPIMVFAFPFVALSKVFISYFYACEENLFSYLLVYCDPLIFTPIALLTLPKQFLLDGVWISFVAAQVATVLLQFFLMISHKKKMQQKEAEVSF